MFSEINILKHDFVNLLYYLSTFNQFIPNLSSLDFLINIDRNNLTELLNEKKNIL